MLSFEAPAMEVMGLIQRWRERVRREEKQRERERVKGSRLNLFLPKRKKKMVTWRVKIGRPKTQLLRKLLTQFLLVIKVRLKIRGCIK